MSNIITLAGYKDYAGIKSTQSDDQLQVAIDYACSLIEQYCNTKFEPTGIADRRVTVLPGEYELVIPHAPVISVAEVKTVQDGEDVEILDLAQCYVELDTGILTLPYDVSVPYRRNNVSLSYTYGYATVPAAVALAAYELVTHISKREYMKSKSVDGQNANFADPKILPTHIRTALDLFKVL